MSDRLSLSKAAGQIAWGYVLIFFHFNLGTIDILPNWVGYILISKAITVIGQEKKVHYYLIH